MVMSDDSDGNVIDLPRSRPKTGPTPSVISELLAKSQGGQEPDSRWTEAEQEEEQSALAGPVPAIEELVALPKAGDPYKAYSLPAARMLPTLWLLPGDGTRRGFPYSGRIGGPDLMESPGGLVIVLRFSDVVPKEVLLAGRNLDTLLEYIGYHKIAWVRALPSGKMIPDRAMPVVTNITVRPWKPEEDGGG
jgi:hypothetical protein